MLLKETLSTFLVSAHDAGCQKLVIAYSGGIDSHVLLEQLNKLNQGNNAIPMVALYVNHNLHQASKEWGEHCQLLCHSLEIPFKQLQVQAKPSVGESPEEKARMVRYQALEAELERDHWLLTAQHMDDQAETLLLQLLRGSGVDGLSSMPMMRLAGAGEHHRPLLKVTKQQIEQYATEHQLKWIEDPSNQDQQIARNYLRKTVLPTLKKFWHETAVMFDRSAGWLGEAAEILEDVAKQDWLLCVGDFQSLKISKLKKLALIRQKNLLRYWFHRLGLKRPGQEKLEVILQQIINAREDANPRLDWQGICVRRYRDRLYCLPQWPVLDSDWVVDWDGITAISLIDDWATIQVNEVSGRGLSKRVLQQPLILKLRKGGERCQPMQRSQNRSLKKLFQEYSVPPWLRDRWPLLYCNEQLIAVPGLFVCKGFEAKSSERGLDFNVEGEQVFRQS